RRARRLWRITSGACAQGNFVAPRVLGGCSDTITIAQEEIFGPVMAILDFDHEEDVVCRANATPYELPAELSRETSRARIGWRSRLDVGVVWLTTAMSRRPPWHSAVGSYRVLAARRQGGSCAALAHKMEMKRVYVGLGDIESYY